jgi:hypothetical protein
MLVVENARPGVVGVEDNCAVVVEVVVAVEIPAIADAGIVPIAIADVDLVVVVGAAAVDDFVAVVGGLAAVQAATGRLEQSHSEGLLSQFCGFR